MPDDVVALRAAVDNRSAVVTARVRPGAHRRDTAHPARLVARTHQAGVRKLAVHPHAVDDPRDPDEEADQEGQAEEHDDDLEQASTFHEAMMPHALRPSLSSQTSMRPGPSRPGRRSVKLTPPIPLGGRRPGA